MKTSPNKAGYVFKDDHIQRWWNSPETHAYLIREPKICGISNRIEEKSGNMGKTLAELHTQNQRPKELNMSKTIPDATHGAGIFTYICPT